MLAIFAFPIQRRSADALDWILHTWLFFSPYQLHGMQVNWVEEGTLAVPLVMK